VKSTLIQPLTFAVSTLASVVALRSTPAEAGYINQAPHNCTRVNGSTQFYLTTSLLSSLDTNAETKFMCPIRSDNRHPHGSMTSLRASVEDQNTFNGTGGKVRVAACVAYSLSFGGVCGTTAATSGTGIGSSLLTVSRTKLSENPGEYPYLFLTLPQRQNGGGAPTGISGLLGYSGEY
jgi:hypothetical protein